MLTNKKILRLIRLENSPIFLHSRDSLCIINMLKVLKIPTEHNLLKFILTS